MKTLLFTALFLAMASIASAIDIKLLWESNDPAEEVVRYNIYHKTTDSVWEQLGYTQGSTEYLVNDLPAGIYEYYVTAVNKMGLESPQSDSVTANLLVPSAPTGLNAELIILVLPR